MLGVNLQSKKGTIFRGHVKFLKKVWCPEYGDEIDYLHTFISRLRRKLEPDSPKPLYIATMSGVGYRFSK
jgi:two-component system KDP operon response regulator KdpE